MPSAGGQVPTHTLAPASASALAMAKPKPAVVGDARDERALALEIDAEHAGFVSRGAPACQGDGRDLSCQLAACYSPGAWCELARADDREIACCPWRRTDETSRRARACAEHRPLAPRSRSSGRPCRPDAQRAPSSNAPLAREARLPRPRSRRPPAAACLARPRARASATSRTWERACAPTGSTSTSRRRNKGPLPVVLYVHGGVFVWCSKETHFFVGHTYANAGFVVFNLNYRLAPRHKLPGGPRGRAPKRCAGCTTTRHDSAATHAASCWPASRREPTWWRRWPSRAARAAPEPWARALFDAGSRAAGPWSRPAASSRCRKRTRLRRQAAPGPDRAARAAASCPTPTWTCASPGQMASSTCSTRCASSRATIASSRPDAWRSSCRSARTTRWSTTPDAWPTRWPAGHRRTRFATTPGNYTLFTSCSGARPPSAAGPRRSASSIAS